MSGFKRETPACFDSDEQYIGWLEQEFITGGGKHRLPVCADCTLAYATRMRDVGRCERPEMGFDAKGNPMYEAGESGFRGVSWHKGMKKWIARKTFGRIQVHLGYFDDKQAASDAWEQATDRGPAYYGIANGVVTEEAKRTGLLVREDRALGKVPRKNGVQERPVWILRHSGSQRGRSISCSDYSQKLHECASEENN